MFEAIQREQLIMAEKVQGLESQDVPSNAAWKLPSCVSLSKALNLSDLPSFNCEMRLTSL